MTNKEPVIPFGIWPCAPVEGQPELVLSGWRVFEVLLLDSTERTRHFAGYSEADNAGRVSSAIMQFDPATMRGVTSSGRVYGLRGKPGLGSDAEYTWNAWKRFGGVRDAVDVTAEVFAGPNE
jgi:hypothetical protein